MPPYQLKLNRHNIWQSRPLCFVFAGSSSSREVRWLSVTSVLFLRARSVSRAPSREGAAYIDLKHALVLLIFKTVSFFNGSWLIIAKRDGGRAFKLRSNWSKLLTWKIDKIDKRKWKTWMNTFIFCGDRLKTFLWVVCCFLGFLLSSEVFYRIY